MKSMLVRALKDADSRPVKVFVFPRQKDQKRVADGRVRFNKNFLYSNREKFRKWIIENMEEPFGTISHLDFAEPKGNHWTDDLNDTLVLLGALDILGFGRVVGNTRKEEELKAKGFNIFPFFKFKER